jgi:DNA-binding GntR family transcriptional regulator
MSNLTEHVYAEIKKKIISGFFAPETKMREEHIAQEMGVSRTPVRAALSRLVEEGLLSLKGRTPVITSWTSWDLLEVFDLRIMLESHAAGLAAERATEEDIGRLEALNTRMEAALQDTGEGDDRVSQIQRINNEFHHVILEASKSGRLQELLGSYLDVPMIVGSFYFYQEADLRSSLEQHRVIVAAIRMRNSELAKQAMQLHIMASKARHKARIEATEPVLR